VSIPTQVGIETSETIVPSNQFCYYNFPLQVNLFNQGLPKDRKYNKLKEHQFATKHSMEGFATVQMGVKSLAALTMFGERGLYSGHVYQPDVNHRQVNFWSYHDATNTEETGSEKSGVNSVSLIESMVNPSEVRSFSNGNLMSFLCYELEPVPDASNNNLAIKSPSALRFTLGEDQLDTYGTGFIDGYRAKNLTDESFRRTLDVFGMVSTSTRCRTPLGVDKIACFFQEICKHNLSTTEGLQTFLKEFKLERFYQITKEPIEQQLHQLFTVIRSLTPLRLAAYDGRHRFNLSCYFATGFFSPSTELKLERSNFNLAFPGKNFHQTAVFQAQRLELSYPNNPTFSLSTAFQVLRKQSFVSTASQSLSVRTSWDSLIPEFIEQLINSQEALQLQKFCSQSYWEPDHKQFTVLKTNYDIVFGAFCAFLEEAPETRLRLARGNVQKDVEWKILRDEVGSRNTAATSFGKKRKLIQQSQAPRDLNMICGVLKWLCDSVPNLTMLRRYFQVRSPRVTQAATTSEDRAVHKSLLYLRWSIVGVVIVASEFLTQRYTIEKHMLDLVGNHTSGQDLEEAGKEALVRDRMETAKKALEEYPSLAYWDDTVGLFSTMWDELHGKMNSWTDGEPVKGYLNENSLGKNNQRVTTKLKFALQASMFRDILDTIGWFGFNGYLTWSGSKNHALHLYLQ
jgi:hypothetical protein